jgi:Flp pilus assembly protein TadG
MNSIQSTISRAPIRKTRRGQSLVEFALILPVLLLIMFGVVDLGRAFYISVVLSNVAREGARYAALNPTATATDIRQAALAEAGGAGVGLAEGNIDLTLPIERGKAFTVTVNYQFDLVMGFILGSSIPLSQSTTMYIP